MKGPSVRLVKDSQEEGLFGEESAVTEVILDVIIHSISKQQAIVIR
jgi:hypothetical protein